MIVRVDDVITSAIKYIADAHYKTNLKDIRDTSVNRLYSSYRLDHELIVNKTSIITKMGLEEDVVLKLLNKMPVLLFLKESEIRKRLSFVYNGTRLYAVIYCYDNNYEWTNFNYEINDFEEMQFSKFLPKQISDDENYIIRMIIDSTSRNDISTLAKISSNDSLENKVYKLKKLKINTSGYRIV